MIFIYGWNIVRTDIADIATLPKLVHEALILAALRRGDRHGYQIALDIEKNSGGMVAFRHGTLYPILHKLERHGYIRGKWRAAGETRKRKYYSLAPHGYTHLAELKRNLSAFFAMLNTLMGDAL